MEPNKSPATSTVQTIPEQKEEAMWFAYQELVEKHKELIQFTKSIGVYDLYEPRTQHVTTH
jgi:hypothetical protein